ncbi:hypothetical protein [Sulfurimonas sp.]|uniref:hypothetical protein n=1 Tax=Sulfurimonas sp. TaxID=2022749 RepID=UPI0026179179|nr:hypothetical protein [Sulfurimonas sp.]
MENLSEIIWYLSWPILIYISLKFVQLNLGHFEKMERLEELEALHAEDKLGK